MPTPHAWEPLPLNPRLGLLAGCSALGCLRRGLPSSGPLCLPPSPSWLPPPLFSPRQDNFGYDLPAVEAALKKHEAIEADISSYQERIQVVVDLAQGVESEGYYDSKRISAQKDNILRQWGLLTELVSARRARLEQNVALQKVFQEMVYMIDWMDDMQVRVSLGNCCWRSYGACSLSTPLAVPGSEPPSGFV